MREKLNGHGEAESILREWDGRALATGLRVVRSEGQTYYLGRGQKIPKNEASGRQLPAASA